MFIRDLRVAESVERKHLVLFFTHDNFPLDARAVKRIKGCVTDIILVVVYWLILTCTYLES